MPPVAPENALAGGIEENRIYKLKKTGASADDIINVWNYVSSYISCQMRKTKGVNVIGLGTFTFTQKKTDVGNNKYLLVQRPVFVLSEKFAQQHQLSCTKHHLTGQIPVADLNYTAVAYDTPFSRDLVEECVRDVISEFSRAISAGKNIEFSFSTVGRLTIRNRKVKMRFYKEFINSMDDSGEMIASMKDRPETADSVMSRCSVRPQSMNTMVLPSIGEKKASRKPSMNVIDENAEVCLDNVGHVDDPVMQKAIEEMEKKGEQYLGNNEGCNPEIDGGMNVGYNEMGARELDDMGLPGMLLEEQPHPDTIAAKEMIQRSGSRMLAPLSMAGAVNFDDITPRPASHAQSRIMGEPPARSGVTPRPESLQRSNTMPVMDSTTKPLSPIVPGTHRSQQGRASSAGAPWPAEARGVTPAGSECGHNAGQELCYLCHQRAARNIPVSFEEERKKREAEEDKVLHDYQIMKNNEFILKENEKNMARRHTLAKVAAFNQGVAEALTEKKNARPQKERPHAYIFQRRPLTPPRYIKQQQLNDYLAKQVGAKEGNAKTEKAEQAFLERLEQVQLAEDLAAQRDQFMKEKAQEREKYKEALSTQLRDRWADNSKNQWWNPLRQTEYLLKRNMSIFRPIDPDAVFVNNWDRGQKERWADHSFEPTLDFLVKYKPLQVPDKLPDNEVFGKHDTTQADIIARREHSKRIADEMSTSMSDRKRAEILKKLQEQQDEEMMLKKNRQELLDERARRYDRAVKNRRALEHDWVKSTEDKRGRDVEERLRCLTPGHLVHEQCDQYKRCTQCKKRLGNCGETNLWRESRYIPGARVMV